MKELTATERQIYQSEIEALRKALDHEQALREESNPKSLNHHCHYKDLAQKLEKENQELRKQVQQLTLCTIEKERMRKALSDLSGVVAFCAPSDDRFDKAQDNAFAALDSAPSPILEKLRGVAKALELQPESGCEILHAGNPNPCPNCARKHGLSTARELGLLEGEI